MTFSYSTSALLVVLSTLATSCQGYITEAPPLPGATFAPPSLPELKTLVKQDKTMHRVKLPERITWTPEGHNTWEWKGQKINYIEMGDKSKPALLLIHGFGVSAYHFRENIPELAKDYHVYAFDMLGFGLSDMPVEDQHDYEPETWRDQTIDFVTDVIGKPTTIAGNSLGGLAALYASADEKLKPLVSGCILLNAALRFKSKDPTHAFMSKSNSNTIATKNKIMDKVWGSFQRMVLSASFEYTKQPQKIEQMLHNVYAVDTNNVDQELIESIQHSSQHENAAEVYYRVLSKNGPGTNVFADDLLANLDCPLMLCWGQKDPWFGAHACSKIQSLYEQTTRADINAGHCPHDECPEEVNSAIHAFMAKNCV